MNLNLLSIDNSKYRKIIEQGHLIKTVTKIRANTEMPASYMQYKVQAISEVDSVM